MTDKITAALAALDKATPGPWEVVEDIFLFQPDIKDGNGRSVATIRMPYPMNKITQSSNATLIAAAPDLAAEVIRLRKWQAEAIKRMEGWRDSLIETNDFGGLQYLDRLIAEAEGD